MKITPALLLVVLAVFASQPARACTYTTSVFEGYPLHGATEVPTDAVLWVSGVFGADVDPVRLVDAEGVEVAATLRTAGSDGVRVYVELVPASPLAPRTTYRLVVADGLAEHSPRAEIELTTGDGPLAAPPPSPPSLRTEMVSRGENVSSSCGDELIACIATDEDVQLEATLGTEIVRSATSELTFDTAGESLCIEVRARDAIGRLSEPVTICSDVDAPIRVVPAASATRPIWCAGGEVIVDGVDLDELAPPAGGCTVSRARATSALPMLAAALACALALRSRRRGR